MDICHNGRTIAAIKGPKVTVVRARNVMDIENEGYPV